MLDGKRDARARVEQRLDITDENKLMISRVKIESAGPSIIVPPAVTSIIPRGVARRLNSWLRDFPWLTSQRVAFYSGMLLLAYLIAAIAQLHGTQHLVFASGMNVGGDFVDPYAASVAALAGDPASVYDIRRQHARQAAVTEGKDTGVLGFHYPPMFLLLVLPLAMLPYVASWVVFEVVTLCGYLAVLRRIAPVSAGLWLAIAFPAVIINFMCGQNGFLTTALLGGGLLLLDRRPLLAGVALGLMVYKPQFAILVPFALMAARQWRVLIATAISTVVFMTASLVVFGSQVWRAFIHSTAFTRKVVLEHGAINFATLQSTFGAVRMWGAGIDTAYFLHGVVALYAAAAVVWVWQRDRPFALKAASLAVGSLMVSPYVLQYDLVLLALPIAWLAMEGFQRGFLPYEKIVLAMAWVLPRISLPLSQGARVPFAPFVIIALMTMILIRASSVPNAERLPITTTR
jgi:alpha-1,2-mannosyltransferase